MNLLKKIPHIVLLLALVFGLAACPAKSEFPDLKSKIIARQVTVGMTAGFEAVVDSCLYVMRGIAEEDTEKAKVFAKQCYKLVKPVSKSIDKAAAAVDAWDQNPEGAFRQVVCSAKDFAVFWPAAKTLINTYTEPPKMVDDVVVFVHILADVSVSCPAL